MTTFSGPMGDVGNTEPGCVRTWFNGFMDTTNKRRTVSLNAGLRRVAFALPLFLTRSNHLDWGLVG